MNVELPPRESGAHTVIDALVWACCIGFALGVAVSYLLAMH